MEHTLRWRIDEPLLMLGHLGIGEKPRDGGVSERSRCRMAVARPGHACPRSPSQEEHEDERTQEQEDADEHASTIARCEFLLAVRWRSGYRLADGSRGARVQDPRDELSQ